MTVRYNAILKVEIGSKRSPFVWSFKSEGSVQYAVRKVIFVLYQKSSFLLMEAEMWKLELVDLFLRMLTALLP